MTKCSRCGKTDIDTKICSNGLCSRCDDIQFGSRNEFKTYEPPKPYVTWGSRYNYRRFGNGVMNDDTNPWTNRFTKGEKTKKK